MTGPLSSGLVWQITGPTEIIEKSGTGPSDIEKRQFPHCEHSLTLPWRLTDCDWRTGGLVPGPVTLLAGGGAVVSSPTDTGEGGELLADSAGGGHGVRWLAV